MILVICIAVFATLGFIASGWDGLFGGAIAGLIIGIVGEIFARVRIGNRISELENRIGMLEARLLTEPEASIAATAVSPATASETPADTAVPADSPPTAATTPAPVASDNPYLKSSRHKKSSQAHSMQAAKRSSSTRYQPREPNSFDKAIAVIGKFFTTGNPVVKIGALVLLVGVGFALKLAIDQGVFPLELRFAAIGLLAIVIVAVGWRVRANHLAYSLILQGTGIGILYMTVFTAVKVTPPLLPSLLAMLLMIGLVLFSGSLAVLQNALSLAVIATIGGFLAPVLVSTGEGSHIMLFSYYALLNCGVLGVAWFKAWRILNLLGFLFTFVIGIAWGVLRYKAEFFATTEPFLILFFFMYLAIAVLYGLRRSMQVKTYVDGSLVFGLPAIAFTVQISLVEQFLLGPRTVLFSSGGCLFVINEMVVA